MGVSKSHNSVGTFTIVAKEVQRWLLKYCGKGSSEGSRGSWHERTASYQNKSLLLKSLNLDLLLWIDLSFLKFFSSIGYILTSPLYSTITA